MYQTFTDVLKLTYYWLHSYTPELTQFEMGISSRTSVDWYMFTREVCEEGVIHHSEPIDGPDKHVQIDKTKFGKCKFNQGRHVDGEWVGV